MLDSLRLGEGFPTAEEIINRRRASIDEESDDGLEAQEDATERAAWEAERRQASPDRDYHPEGPFEQSGPSVDDNNDSTHARQAEVNASTGLEDDVRTTEVRLRYLSSLCSQFNLEALLATNGHKAVEEMAEFEQRVAKQKQLSREWQKKRALAEQDTKKKKEKKQERTKEKKQKKFAKRNLDEVSDEEKDRERDSEDTSDTDKKSSTKKRTASRRLAKRKHSYAESDSDTDDDRKEHPASQPTSERPAIKRIARRRGKLVSSPSTQNPPSNEKAEHDHQDQEQVPQPVSKRRKINVQEEQPSVMDMDDVPLGVLLGLK